jgi:hypothetical protein
VAGTNDFYGMPDRQFVSEQRKAKDLAKEQLAWVKDEQFWRADSSWSAYFIGNSVWVYYDEYNAQLIGDEDCCRIIVHSGNTYGPI